MKKQNILLIITVALHVVNLSADIVSDIDSYVSQLSKAQDQINTLKAQIAPVIANIRNEQIPNLQNYKNQKDTYESTVNSQVISKFNGVRSGLSAIKIGVTRQIVLAAYDKVLASTGITGKLNNLSSMFSSLGTLLNGPLISLPQIANQLEEQNPLMDNIVAKLEEAKTAINNIKTVLAPPPPPATPPAPAPSW